MSSAVAVVTVGELTARMAEILGSRDEARELLALVRDEPRHWPTTARDAAMSPADVEAALGAAERRAAGMPVQYAAGLANFRHLTLAVDERVLIPRPETELLVDLVLEATRLQTGGVLVDVGTGSGAIAIALAVEGTFDRVIATDLSRDALDVAAGNARRSGVDVDLRHGSLLAPVRERGLRAVVSNPPYISHDEAAALPAAVRDWEPSVALFSGDDGMAATAQLVRDAAGVLAPGGLLAIEVDVRRASRVAGLAGSLDAYDDVRVVLDLTGRERFVVATRRESER